jgi:hypothetical protein
MTRGIGNILGGLISSALVSSNMADPHLCSGFPKGSFSGLIWFIGILFLSSGLLGSFLWLHFRKTSKEAQESCKNENRETSEDFAKF